jgi:hypothetical protein
LLDQGALAVFRLLPDLWREGVVVLSGCFLAWIDHDFGALSMMKGRITMAQGCQRSLWKSINDAMPKQLTFVS